MRAGVAGCSLLSQEALDKLNRKGQLLKHKTHKMFTINDISRNNILGPNHRRSFWTIICSASEMLLTGVGSLMNIHFTGPAKLLLLQGLFWQHMLQYILLKEVLLL